MSVRVQPTTQHGLERLAAQARGTFGGSKATASSVAGFLLDRAVLAQVDHTPPAVDPLPAVLAPPWQAASVPFDVGRLRRAMGAESANAVDGLAGCSRGTCGKALRGTPLAKAGGGKLLAWVVAVEASR